ncbi:hypothetical protein [Azospirillum sp. TSO35-2]|uniref:hypothetical protein n=1 Tax=Azospirillum sp. TSO35-2 TaxID=716796 RepID=UPI000D61F22F|nr:hypothetical protein [Azospirillum sp. TSO35-2]PWC31254.1 hypothetical protein TSO352_31170 [Azospirillum sp. TSO35-2]
MDVLEFLTTSGPLALVPLLVIAPLLFYRWVVDAAGHWEVYGRRRVAVVEMAGVLIGVCFIATTPLPGGALSLDGLFASGGPWDIDAVTFRTIVVERLWEAPDSLADRIARDDQRLNLTLGLGIALALLLGRQAAGFASLHWRPAVVSVAIDLIIASLTAVTTLYTALLLLWMLNRLNFWVLAVAILAIQEYRYNVLGLFHRQRHFRIPKALVPMGAPVVTSRQGTSRRRFRAGDSTRGTGRKSGV